VLGRVGKKVGLVGWLAAQEGGGRVVQERKWESGANGPAGARHDAEKGAGLVRHAGLRAAAAARAWARSACAGPRERSGPGGRGRAGWPSAAGWSAREKGGGWASLFPIFLYFLFSISYYFKSNSLLNACFTSSLIKQNESTLQHDATIKAPPRVLIY
jgi:hypothetical protein